MSAGAVVRISSAARDCVHRSTEFLLDRRGADNLWRDFETLAGQSSDWVTAFVTYALSRSLDDSRVLLPSIKELLFRQRPNGGWSYNESVPTDCDSTAWVLLALSTAPIARPSTLMRARRYLLGHQDDESGGFSTYDPRDGIDRYLRVSNPRLLRGWYAAHPCVTAVAMRSLSDHAHPTIRRAVRRAADHLMRTREPCGRWRSYWWNGLSYGSYHALCALGGARIIDRLECRRALDRVIADQRTDGGWTDRSLPNGDVFATAFSLLTLLLVPDEPSWTAAGRGVAFLLGAQEADGGWPSTPILRIPRPFSTEPGRETDWIEDALGTGVVIADAARLFTTAAATWAVATYSRMGGSAGEGGLGGVAQEVVASRADHDRTTQR
jgi:squalene cyclase